jgi:SseB protein N-terminal domain
MEQNIRNDQVRTAIENLSAPYNTESRAELYRQLTEGFLLLAVANVPSGSETTGAVLEQDTPINVLTTATPEGGTALVAFTDVESLQARMTAVPYLALNSQDVLQLVIQQGHDALVLNPAGPWVMVPREDVSQILAGAWSDQR